MKYLKVSSAFFDMDGVVIDTKLAVKGFWNRLARNNSMVISNNEFEQHVYGYTASHTISMLFPFFNDEMRDNAIKNLEQYERKIIYKKIKGITQFIKNIKKNDIRTALVTSAYPYKVEMVVKQLHLDSLFDIYLTGCDIKNSKPDPECYLVATERLCADPGESFVFEDSISGVKAAVSAGIRCIGINEEKSGLLEAGAIFIVDNFLDKKIIEYFGLN